MVTHEEGHEAQITECKAGELKVSSSYFTAPAKGLRPIKVIQLHLANAVIIIKKWQATIKEIKILL